jgi:creatinase
MIMSQTQRPEFFELQNGSKANLPFSDNEYETRLGKLRALMADSSVDAMLLTSMHNIAYYSGFLYCSFGRPYACVVTAERCVTASRAIT